MGFLYVMGTDNDLCKVGRTDGRVEERRRQIQTGCPYEITKVWHSDDIEADDKCERIVHAALAGRRTSGEWFSIPFNECVLTADRVCRENAEDENKRLFRILFERLNTLERDLLITKREVSTLAAEER